LGETFNYEAKYPSSGNAFGKAKGIDNNFQVLKPATTSIMNKLQKKRMLTLIVGRKSNREKD
jgi:hypothetical protein